MISSLPHLMTKKDHQEQSNGETKVTTIEIVFSDEERGTIDQEETFRDQLNLTATIQRIFDVQAVSWVHRPRAGVGKVCMVDGVRTRFAEVRFWSF